MSESKDTVSTEATENISYKKPIGEMKFHGLRTNITCKRNSEKIMLSISNQVTGTIQITDGSVNYWIDAELLKQAVDHLVEACKKEENN